MEIDSIKTKGSILIEPQIMKPKANSRKGKHIVKLKPNKKFKTDYVEKPKLSKEDNAALIAKRKQRLKDLTTKTEVPVNNTHPKVKVRKIVDNNT